MGFEKAGFQIEFVNEYQPNFMSAYKYATRKKMNIKPPKYGYYNTDINEFWNRDKRNYKKIWRMQKGWVTCRISGRPSCPDFSIAGKNKGRDGINGKLSSSYVKLIANMKPDFFLFENVKGLWRTARHREYF